MVLIGTLVNGAAIIIAALIGLQIKQISDNLKTTVMQALSLAIIVLGITMAIKTEQFIIVISSLVIGAILGEKLNVDGWLNRIGFWVEKRLGASQDGKVAKAFVTTTLIYVVGAMAILGALDSGLRGDHSVLFTKSLLDGVSSLIFASTMGIGVALSAIPVILYQGGIALFAGQINTWVPDILMDTFIIEMTSVGGILIIAIGLNLLGLTQIKVANLLMSIPVVACIVTILYIIPL
ncbi:DUF554 domain-containing protein [Alkalihalobacillus pseudalcaliphilus]|uniref:DUF554 domain-containing protein n=1 Tax=Alkalihalobacillus pseudalcaliphilus TaxID=79884 RepID=UPI00064D7B4E|nr:DUF554 domain-containing protein [Alkalihalobacillus pseudalcaliphilus]KMK77905.1 membrane protein [Alkalihalobacillus pseudalcaliphilus]